MEMDDALHERITELSELGNDRMEALDFPAAINIFEEALQLVPQPQTDWEAGTWLHASIGEAHFRMKDFPAAKASFYTAASSMGGEANPFVLLRLGESLFELGEFEKSKVYLTQARMLEGSQLFADEPAKYLEFLNRS